MPGPCEQHKAVKNELTSSSERQSPQLNLAALQMCLAEVTREMSLEMNGGFTEERIEEQTHRRILNRARIY
jgi:hypothetical protein